MTSLEDAPGITEAQIDALIRRSAEEVETQKNRIVWAEQEREEGFRKKSKAEHHRRAARELRAALFGRPCLPGEQRWQLEAEGYFSD